MAGALLGLRAYVLRATCLAEAPEKADTLRKDQWLEVSERWLAPYLDYESAYLKMTTSMQFPYRNRGTVSARLRKIARLLTAQ